MTIKLKMAITIKLLLLISVISLILSEQIISEEFFIKMLRKKAYMYKNSFKDASIESAFADKAEEFTKWLETASYENENEEEKPSIKNKLNLKIRINNMLRSVI